MTEDRTLITFNITILDKYSLSLRLFHLNQPLACIYMLLEPISITRDDTLEHIPAGVFGITPMFSLTWAKLR